MGYSHSSALVLACVSAKSLQLQILFRDQVLKKITFMA